MVIREIYSCNSRRATENPADIEISRQLLSLSRSKQNISQIQAPVTIFTLIKYHFISKNLLEQPGMCTRILYWYPIYLHPSVQQILLHNVVHVWCMLNVCMRWPVSAYSILCLLILVEVIGGRLENDCIHQFLGIYLFSFMDKTCKWRSSCDSCSLLVLFTSIPITSACNIYSKVYRVLPPLKKTLHTFQPSKQPHVHVYSPHG